MLNNLLQMHLKRFQNEQLKKTAEATGDLIGNKIANKMTKASKSYQRIVQGQLQMKQKILNLIEKYQKKDIYLFIGLN